MENKDVIRENFAKKHPENYTGIVKSVVEILKDDSWYEQPDHSRIHLIDDGDYQGTFLFVIAAEGYQPCVYWCVLVSYGSCSRCDTFESIREYGDDNPTEQQLNDYMTLALHIVQGIKEINSDDES